jgi:hypothetical protein
MGAAEDDVSKTQARAPNAGAFDVRHFGRKRRLRHYFALLSSSNGSRDHAERYFRFSSLVTV